MNSRDAKFIDDAAVQAQVLVRSDSVLLNQAGTTMQGLVTMVVRRDRERKDLAERLQSFEWELRNLKLALVRP